jgi:hypothetical protein
LTTSAPLFIALCRFLVTSDHGNSDDMVQREKKTNKPLMDKDSGGSNATETCLAAGVHPVRLGKHSCAVGDAIKMRGLVYVQVAGQRHGMLCV